MATFQKRLTQDGETRWRVLVRLQGHPVHTATFERKSDAQRWAKQTESAILAGRHFPTGDAKKRTLAELVERYISDVLPGRPAKDRGKVANQMRWWLRQLGDRRLGEITPALIAEARDALGRDASPRAGAASEATRNRYLAVLSHAFSTAEKEWGWAEQNPCRKVRRAREPRGRVRFLSDEERERLLRACQESPEPRLYPLMVLALATGARQGELLRLRWADIDLERRQAVLHHTKNRERRALPISRGAAEVLEAHFDKRCLETDLVFGDASGKALFPRGAWERALQAAKIEGFRFHDLRHSAASYLAMSGATLAEIAEVLGHKTLAMVKRYSHLTDQHTQSVVERMNGRIFGSSGSGEST